MKGKKITALLLALVMAFMLAGCGGSPSAAKRTDYASSAAAPVPRPAAENAAFGLYSDAPAEEPAAYADMDESAGLGSDNGALPASGAPSAGEISVEKIIYSASATVETTDFDASVEKLEAMLAACGGFVESSSVNGNNYYSTSHGYASTRSANYRIRIPSQSFSAVMSSLSTLGNVPYSSTYTENITSQYYDVQARLNACRTQEQSLLDMMAKAETVSDLLEIQEQLSEVRYRIESLQSTLTNWDRQVSYSTISLSLEEVREYTPEARLSFGQQLSLALSRGIKSIGEFFRDLLLWLLEALPALILLAVVVFLVVLLIRRIRRNRAARRAAKAAAAPPAAPEEPRK